MSYNIENVGGAYGRPTIAGPPPGSSTLPAPFTGRPTTGAYYMDSSGHSGSDSSSVHSGSSAAGGVEWGNIQGAELIDMEDELQSDLEVLRKKNLELRAELEILKHSEHKGIIGGLFGKALSTPSVTNG